MSLPHHRYGPPGGSDEDHPYSGEESPEDFPSWFAWWEWIAIVVCVIGAIWGGWNWR